MQAYGLNGRRRGEPRAPSRRSPCALSRGRSPPGGSHGPTRAQPRRLPSGEPRVPATEGGGPWGNHGFPHVYRGAQIRTGDLSDPNGARYQAAPHPERATGYPLGRSTVRRRRLAAVAGRDEIVAYANELLEVERWPEFAPPGLQVVGAPEVTTLACGVSCSRDALRARGRSRRRARARPPRALLAQRAARRRRAAARPARGALPRRTHRSSPTTSRSTRTRRSATPRSSPRGSARRPSAPSAASGSAARSTPSPSTSSRRASPTRSGASRSSSTASLTARSSASRSRPAPPATT